MFQKQSLVSKTDNINSRLRFSARLASVDSRGQLKKMSNNSSLSLTFIDSRSM